MSISQFVILIAVAVMALLVFGPRMKVDFDTAKTRANRIKPEDVDEYLTAAEGRVENIKPDQQKHVVWAGEAGVKTDISIVYLHGFTASLGEIRPVPDDVARALGANLYYSRLTGHGQEGLALANLHVNAWIEDAIEALNIGRAIGRRVIIMGTSTGGTLATVMARSEVAMQNVAGMIMVSPNFAVQSRVVLMGGLGFFNRWGPWVVGKTQSWTPRSKTHGHFWTSMVGTRSVIPMTALTVFARTTKHEDIKIPALFYYADDDQVVKSRITDKILAKWGAPATAVHPDLGEADDPMAHLITGDAMSPSQNEHATTAMLNFIKSVT